MLVVAAIVRREFQVQRRYPLSMINLVLLTPLYEMALPALLLGSAFLVNGSAVGLATMAGTDDLAGWLGLGLLAASLLVGAVWGVSGTLKSDRDTGVLEHSFATPVPRESFVVGAVLTGTLFTLVASGVLLAFAIGFLGASYRLTGVLLSVPVVLVMLLGNCGFGYLTGAATLRLRRPDSLVDPLTTLASVFSGITFPLTVLPPLIRPLTYVLPTTWGLDIIRHLSLGTTPLLPLPYEVVGLAVTSTAFLLVGRWAFVRAERQVTTAGTLTQF
ncbi:ABC transporter permease [Nonomuraea aurantiaca]|uniref:ABC transporter permease n=1 Tax=Nonomuraea aurantiaca TaxID=2878562 RepID=UPI001CD9C1F3|nr:ABC transporter permease [Nonomuraea aurantiaca]MCA2227866.1 ABC transporter permease [Nonomuraea aurantiaca]